MKKHPLTVGFAGFLLVLLFAVPIQAAGKTQITAGFVAPGEMEMAGFSLTNDGNIHLSGAAGVFQQKGNQLLFYGWILDTDTRKVVWHMLENRKRLKKKVNTFDTTISLPKGNYEVYYTAQLNHSGRFVKRNYIRFFSGIVKDIFGKDSQEYSRKFRAQLKLTVSSPGDNMREIDPINSVNQRKKEALISFCRTGDDKRSQKAFALDKKTALRIYAVGESDENGIYDYAWIQDLKTYKRVWTMTPNNTKHAGGSRKNISFDKKITLPAGTYAVHYVSDGSHSYEKWNSLPPDDTQFWGVTIWPASPTVDAKPRLVESIKPPKAILELVKAKNGALLYQGLIVKRQVDVRILCFGESENDGRGDLHDYGWIENADTRQKIWQMKERNHQHAGGAIKNRVADEVFTLYPGNYIVKYVTDGSHSYRGWNAAPPYAPEGWGITLWAAEKGGEGVLEVAEPDSFQSDKIVSRIVDVRDNADLRKDFRLDEDTVVRIIAVGEGIEDAEMVDYGWIVSKDTGETVWEMTYHKTRHAGGAEKNRIFNGTITLKKGQYELRYQSDNSHAYMSWNDAPPEDNGAYGIILIKEK